MAQFAVQESALTELRQTGQELHRLSSSVSLLMMLWYEFQFVCA